MIMTDDMKKLAFSFQDYSKRLRIEVKNKNKLQTVQAMLEDPFEFILTRNIYHYLNDNYDEIKLFDMLTTEEEELLDIFKKYFKEVIEAYDFFMEDQKYHFIDWGENKSGNILLLERKQFIDHI